MLWLVLLLARTLLLGMHLASQHLGDHFVAILVVSHYALLLACSRIGSWACTIGPNGACGASGTASARSVMAQLHCSFGLGDSTNLVTHAEIAVCLVAIWLTFRGSGPLSIISLGHALQCLRH